MSGYLPAGAVILRLASFAFLKEAAEKFGNGLKVFFWFYFVSLLLLRWLVLVFVVVVVVCLLVFGINVIVRGRG